MTTCLRFSRKVTNCGFRKYGPQSHGLGSFWAKELYVVILLRGNQNEGKDGGKEAVKRLRVRVVLGNWDVGLSMLHTPSPRFLLLSPGGNPVVPSTWNSSGLQILLHSCGHLEPWLYLCWDGTEACLSSTQPTLPHIQEQLNCFLAQTHSPLLSQGSFSRVVPRWVVGKG